ncbi:MAG TPA: hypothetical protein VF370_00415 [Candidatus Cryosericum sp.]
MLRTSLLDESERLAEQLLSKNQVEVLSRTAEDITAGIESADLKVDLTPFWKLDARIGGIGGYCMPLRPFGNPFPSGIARELFRPIQYAAAEIEYHGNPLTARESIRNSGMYLEAVTKFWVNRTSSILDTNRYKRLTLGQSIAVLKKRGLVTDGLAESLDASLVLYNQAKHAVTQREDRDRMFTVGDALVVYICARILGMRILKPYYDEILRGIPEYERDFPGVNMNGSNPPCSGAGV